MSNLVPQWYKNLLFFGIMLGAILIYPIVLFIQSFENKEKDIIINEYFYCYLKNCDSTTNVIAWRGPRYFSEYISSFQEVDDCTEFILDSNLSKIVNPYLEELAMDSIYLVESIVEDSAIAKIKMRNFNKSLPSESDYYYLRVPIFAVNDSAPTRPRLSDSGNEDEME